MQITVKNIWVRGIERGMVDVTANGGEREFLPSWTTIKYIISFSNGYIDFNAEADTDETITNFDDAEKWVRKFWGEG